MKNQSQTIEQKERPDPGKKRTGSGSGQSRRILAQSVGVDVSKDSLSCCFMEQSEQEGLSGREVRIRSVKTFPNTPSGIRALKSWVGKWRDLNSARGVNVVMEATGVYHNQLSYGLSDVSDQEGFRVSVVLPNQAKHYAASLSTKTKTDHTDAQMLARMGVERDLPQWQAPSPRMRQIKSLCRERETLRKDCVAVSNRNHALSFSGIALKSAIKRHKLHADFLEKQIKTIDKEIFELVKQDPQLHEQVQHLCTIPGVGWLTAIIVLAETDCFALIHNKNQLTSYAGLDIVERQSGTSLRGKTRISKKGNSHLRAALYFPAIAHVRVKGCFLALFQRLRDRGARGLKAYVAVQRKLLILMYSLHKNKSAYDPDFRIAPPLPQTSVESLSEGITETTSEQIISAPLEVENLPTHVFAP
jgi:transposase